MDTNSLVEDFKTFFENGKNIDVIFKTEPRLYAHSQILYARSKYFRALFSPEWTSRGDESHNELTANVSYFALYKIILYIYTGIIDLRDVDMGTILEILTEGDVFLLEELSSQVVQYLHSDITRFIGKGIVSLVEFIIDNDIFKQKFESLFYDIVKDIKILVFDTNEMLNTQTLEYLIQHDELGVTEGELLFYIRRKKYNIELRDLRVHQIEQNMIMDSLWKEHETINKDILEDVLRSKLNPSWYIPKYGISWIRFTNIGHMSNILNTSLLDTLKTIFSCTFRIKQIFAGIKMFKKMSGKDLYNFCEGKGSLLILGKKRSSSYIVGGYNDNSWDRGIINTTNSFIFHINMYGGFKVATPKENNINCRINTDHGPTFGSGDLRIDGYNWTYEINSYDPDFTRGTHEMEFVEVYQIQKTNKFI